MTRDYGKTAKSANAAFASVTVLFFAWGFITSLIDPLVAAVKGIFSLSDVTAQLSAAAFFIAYGLISIPGSILVARLGAARSIFIALGLMLSGCLIMLAAANLALYVLVLLGLFALASGITILQVAANPLAASLGDPAGSHFRLTLSQTFNSFGTFLGPFLGAVLFLDGLEIKEGAVISDAVRNNALVGIDRAYFWLAGLIFALLLFFWTVRRLVDASAPMVASTARFGETLREGLASRWTMLGAGTIFLYVGAEVSIGTMLALFLHSDAIWGLHDAPRALAPLAGFMQLDATPGVSLQEAAKAVSLYWGGAMVGRIIGTFLLTRVRATALLATFAGIAALLCVYVASLGGAGAGFAAISIGLFNSVMFPTIFTITLERSNARAEITSGMLCTAIVGGAAIPLLAGLVSQNWGYGIAFAVPMVCYVSIFIFALVAARAPAHEISATLKTVH